MHSLCAIVRRGKTNIPTGEKKNSVCASRTFKCIVLTGERNPNGYGKLSPSDFPSFSCRGKLPSFSGVYFFPRLVYTVRFSPFVRFSSVAFSRLTYVAGTCCFAEVLRSDSEKRHQLSHVSHCIKRQGCEFYFFSLSN